MILPLKRDIFSRTSALAAAIAMLLGVAGARADDGIVKSVLKQVGFATDVAPPADFVTQARPAVEEDYVPIFRPPFERAHKTKTPSELKAMESEFDATIKRHDALRAGFAPAVKAVAAAKAAKAGKSASKSTKKPPPDQTQP